MSSFVKQRNILTHFSNLKEKSPRVNHNRGIKLIGVFGWCQTTSFFTYCPPHALHAAQITAKWKCRIFSEYGLISKFASNTSLVARNNHNTRITSQSLRPITHTMLTPPGIFVNFEVNYVRVSPSQRSSFQINDWLVWQLRDCVWVFFHVEVGVLESSSCWLEQTSYRRRFWTDSSKHSGRHWTTPNVTCCCQHQIQCSNKELHRNWRFLTQPPL